MVTTIQVLAATMNMRIFTLLLMSIACSCCQTKSEYVTHAFKLQNKVKDCWAELNCILPVDYDAIYFDTTSTSKCGSIAYHAYAKKFTDEDDVATFKETWEVMQMDSLYSFSIVYAPFDYCDSLCIGQKVNFKEFENYLKSKMEPEGPELNIDTTFQTNGQSYTVLFYKDRIGQTSVYKVDASTIVNNRCLGIYLANNVLSKTEFYHQANRILKSIKIKPV